MRTYDVILNPQLTIVNDTLTKLVPTLKVREMSNTSTIYNTYDDITVWNSYKVNNWSDIKLACQQIKEKANEVKYTPATNRSIKSLAHEWAAHNVLYKFGGANIKKKCVDVNFTSDDSKLMKIGYWFFAMVHHIMYGW